MPHTQRYRLSPVLDTDARLSHIDLYQQQQNKEPYLISSIESGIGGEGSHILTNRKL